MACFDSSGERAVMSIGRGLAFLGLALLTGACAGHGRFLGDEGQTFTALPPTAVVVLYSPAAKGERAPEPCAGVGGLAPLGFLSDQGAVPPVIRALAETGGDLLVYADCSLARGHTGGAAFETVRAKPCFARGAEPDSGYVELKACRRLDDLKRLVQEVKRNLPASRIFVAGAGVGGWAALLAARDPFRKFNAAIVLDPAITGQRDLGYGGRSPPRLAGFRQFDPGPGGGRTRRHAGQRRADRSHRRRSRSADRARRGRPRQRG
jgi:hypothetical protein